MLINIGDVVDGALVNAIALAGRRISVAVDGLRGRRRATDLTVARWFDTYRLAGQPPELPGLSPALIERLADKLRGDEVQAALQELLAARLTDAPETDATAAKQVLGLCLAGPWSVQLADYYDDQICALVARLEADDPKLLAQVRSEAFSARMINILNAIERHTAALTTRPAQRTEASFLASYRRHVTDQHGKLEPPDFDRRRRVPIADIYVPTVITEDLSPERTVVSRPPDQPSSPCMTWPGGSTARSCSATPAAARPPRRTCSCTTSRRTRPVASRSWSRCGSTRQRTRRRVRWSATSSTPWRPSTSARPHPA
jgi:hypothetical protein